MQNKDFLTRLGAPGLLVMPGVHDAASARLAQLAGFGACGIGGSTIAALHHGLPDLGLMSYGEYEPYLRSIVGATELPVMIDAEHGFGDLKTTARTVERLCDLGAGAICLEDMRFPPKSGQRPEVVDLEEVAQKLEVGLIHRRSGVALVGRTDAMVTGDFDQVLLRLRHYRRVGVDAVLATGIQTADQYHAMRDAVDCPIIAVLLESGPWFAPTHDLLAEIGINAALYPAALMLRALGAVRAGLDRLRDGSTILPEGALGYAEMAPVVQAAKWTALDSKEAGNA